MAERPIHVSLSVQVEDNEWPLPQLYRILECKVGGTVIREEATPLLNDRREAVIPFRFPKGICFDPHSLANFSFDARIPNGYTKIDVEIIHDRWDVATEDSLSLAGSLADSSLPGSNAVGLGRDAIDRALNDLPGTSSTTRGVHAPKIEQFGSDDAAAEMEKSEASSLADELGLEKESTSDDEDSSKEKQEAETAAQRRKRGRPKKDIEKLSDTAEKRKKQSNESRAMPVDATPKSVPRARSARLSENGATKAARSTDQSPNTRRAAKALLAAKSDDVISSESTLLKDILRRTAKSYTTGRHLWQIRDFSTMSRNVATGDAIGSESFRLRSLEEAIWSIELYPNGDDSEQDGRNLAVFLTCRTSRPLNVKFRFSVIDRSGKRLVHVVQEEDEEFRVFEPPQQVWGPNRFCSAEQAALALQLPDDSLFVLCEFDVCEAAATSTANALKCSNVDIVGTITSLNPEPAPIAWLFRNDAQRKLSFTWVIEKFVASCVNKLAPGECRKSKRFTNDALDEKGVGFRLELYPNGADEASAGWLGLYVCREPRGDAGGETKELCIAATFSVLGDFGELLHSDRFGPDVDIGLGLGCCNFATIADVTSKYARRGGSVKIRCDLKVCPFTIGSEAVKV